MASVVPEFGCLAGVALQKERLITTRNARTASATMTMPRASSIVSSPQERERTCLPRTPSEGGDLPFARWDRIRGRLSPRSLCYSPAGDCRKRNELTIPDLGETLCGPLEQPPWCVRKRQWLKLLGAAARRQEPREPLLGLKNNAAQCFARATQFAVSRLGPAFQRIGLDGFKTFPRERAVHLCTSEPC